MENNGSVVVYRRLIKPFVKKHEKTIDSAFKTTQQLAGEVASKGIIVYILFSTTDILVELESSTVHSCYWIYYQFSDFRV